MGKEKSTNASVSFEKLLSDAQLELTRQGYSKLTLKYYPNIWKRLSRFAGTELLSEELAERFLNSLGISRISPSQNTSYQNRIRCAVNLLLRYASENSIRFSISPKPPVPLTDEFENALQKYHHFCREHQGGKPETIKSKLRSARKFLFFISTRTRPNLCKIKPVHISEFMQSLSNLCTNTLSNQRYLLKNFLNFLWAYGLHKDKLSLFLPKVRVYQNISIPMVYSPEDVACILDKVDRGSPVGKRDYAIILIAYRLGLRASDICRLKLDDIHWEQSKITIRQVKTGVPLELPLIQDVGNALIDYLKYSRPPVSYREIFITAHGPLRPFGNSRTVTLIFKKYRLLSEIAVPRRQGGIHGLRNSLASKLLSFGFPLKTISDVLGHESLESTRCYLKVDIQSLRKASLNPDDLQSEGLPS